MSDSNKFKVIFYIIAVFVTALSVAAVIVGIKFGVFSSEEAFVNFVRSAGIFAPIVFVIMETLMVVILILPCALGYPVAAAAFGPFWGFMLNAVSTVLGSVIIFMLVSKFGKPLVESAVQKKHYVKYGKFIRHTKLFERILVITFLLPFVPDNVLCYLAGLTNMKFKRFLIIVILFKPWKMIFYTYGSDFFIDKFMNIMSAAMEIVQRI